MIILGIDPGVAIVGFGVIEYSGSKFRTLDYGVIRTPAHTDTEKRLASIYRELKDIIEKYHPDAMAVEELFWNTNQKTGIAVAEARGVILLCAELLGVEIFEYTPLQVKQAVTGYGKAEKNQVMELTRRLLNLEKCPKPDDTADALAMAICHCHSSSSLIFKQMIGGYK